MGIESSGFFNSEYDEQNDKWDREYSAEQIAEYFAKLVSNGVFEGGLQVKQSSNETPTMNVKVSAGNAMINGYWYTLTEEKFFEVNVNATLDTRVDCICVQYNFNNREIKSVYHEGVSTPTRNDEMYELMLCTISVGPNVTSITQSSIADKRYDSTVCGIVTGLIDQINFDEAYSQFSTWFNEFRGRMETDADSLAARVNGVIVTNQLRFDTWFDTIKGILDEDAAGHLQNEIDQLNTSLDTKAAKGDITIISVTGSTNNTGNTISTGTLFYWNGELYKAITDIPNGSTFTRDSNCSPWTTFIEMRLMFSKTDNLTVTSNNSVLDNCTSLESVWQAVKWNYFNGYGKICQSGIGAAENTSVKNVIPNPPGFGNYTQINCKFEASENIIVIYAIGAYLGKLAKCYLFNDRAGYHLTDWQILR